MNETGVRFGADGSLVGIVSKPGAARGADPAGVIILNAGLVHRVGPNRLHVRLARRFAGHGHPTLRFDLSGIGDSAPSRSPLAPPERWVAETRDAMDFLAESAGISRFIVVGSCSGAVVSFRTALADQRVAGLGLINPNGPTLLRHYVRMAASHPSTWRRLLGGRARLGQQYTGLMRRSQRLSHPEAAPADPVSDLRALAERSVNLLLVLSQWDPSYDFYTHVLSRQIEAAGAPVSCHVIPGADHQMSVLANQQQLTRILDDWISAR